MAPRTGYGDAFCALFRPDVACVNLARGGRSSRSYRADGSWDRVRALLADRERSRETFVLIQFGHNDQPGKPERSTDLEGEFPANLARYVDEVESAGARAILVTPLTRRRFRDGALDNDLRPWADAVRRVAQARHLPLLDLNADSADAVTRLGPAEADALAMAPPAFDHTHLGPRGAALFAGMVASELARAVPALATRLVARPQLSAALAELFAMQEVLKYVGPAGSEKVDRWDPRSDPLATGAAIEPDYTVDAAARADGRTEFNTIQSAVNAAVARVAATGRKDRVHIRVMPGIYRELLYVPQSAAPITIYGAGEDAAATRIVATLDATLPGSRYGELFAEAFAAAEPGIAAMFASVRERSRVGTAGSAVAWIRNDGFQARNLTVENAFNRDGGTPRAEGEGRAPSSQAVALFVDGADRVHVENVRLLGLQDTLYLKSPAPGRTVRSYFHAATIEGDVDFIFGDATAYFHRSEIRSLGTRTYSYATAPSTHHRSRFGFVFEDCRFTHDGTPNAMSGRFKLARQWFRGQRCTPYGTVTAPPGYACRLGAEDAFDGTSGTVSRAAIEAVGKVAILDSRIGAHIDKAQPWSGWNAPGTHRYRPVQYHSGDYWANLRAAGIDPSGQMGLPGPPMPAEPFLAEYRSTDE